MRQQHDPFLKRLYKAGAHDAVRLFFPDLASRMLLDTVRTYFALTPSQRVEEERLLQSSPYVEVREMFKTEFERFEEEVEQRTRQKLESEFNAELQRLERERERTRQKLESEFRTEIDRVEEEAKQRTMVQTKQDALLQVMSAKFGKVPRRAASHVRGLDDSSALDGLLQKVARADSLEAMGL